MPIWSSGDPQIKKNNRKQNTNFHNNSYKPLFRHKTSFCQHFRLQNLSKFDDFKKLLIQDGLLKA